MPDRELAERHLIQLLQVNCLQVSGRKVVSENYHMFFREVAAYVYLKTEKIILQCKVRIHVAMLFEPIKTILLI